jgi:hypothetical protein
VNFNAFQENVDGATTAIVALEYIYFIQNAIIERGGAEIRRMYKINTFQL